ncbi:MAG: hypothetical protein VZT48_11695 [Bulleidia sp.]|nr:hypothetical protein [Bulleidia sp.]
MSDTSYTGVAEGVGIDAQASIEQSGLEAASQDASNSQKEPIQISDKKMYKLGGHFNKHGRDMGFEDKKSYEEAARNFAIENQNNPDATIVEGVWGGQGMLHGQTQRAITYDGKTVIISADTGQIIDFYEGNQYIGLIHLNYLRKGK